MHSNSNKLQENTNHDDFMSYLERSRVFKKLKHSSAIILFEDNSLREKITNLIRNITEPSSQNILSSSPEATLPLSILFQNSSFRDIKQIAGNCLKQIIEYQEEMIEYSEKSNY